MPRLPEYVTPVDTGDGKRYEVRVHGARPDGERFQFKRRFKTVKDAIAFHSEVTSGLSKKTYIAPSDLTLQRAVDDWLVGQRIRPNTRAAYVASLRPLVDALGAKPVQAITKRDIEHVVQDLLNGKSKMGSWNAPQIFKGKETRAKWSASSINPMLARARTVFGDLMAEGIVVRNVAALVKPIPTVKPEINTLTAEQAAILLASTDSHCYGVAWRLALLGLRRGEILALEWDGIDFETGTLTIRAARLATPGGVTTAAPKTESSKRVLPMPDELTAALRRARRRQNEAKLQMGSSWPNSGLVVVDDLGNPPYPTTLTVAWATALENAGLPHVRLHDARHSCATLMHLDGVPAVVIAAWLGHTDARFTLATYAHSNNDALADAAVRIGAITNGAAAEGNRA